jgi:hypothetical protein
VLAHKAWIAFAIDAARAVVIERAGTVQCGFMLLADELTIGPEILLDI